MEKILFAETPALSRIRLAINVLKGFFQSQLLQVFESNAEK